MSIETAKLVTATSPENPIEHDLELLEGQLVFADGRDAIAQKCKERLMFFKGEWYQDQNEGFPYWTHVLIKNPSLSTIRSLVTKTLESIRGVQRVISVDASLDKATRSLSIEFSVMSDSNDKIESQKMVLEVPRG